MIFKEHEEFFKIVKMLPDEYFRVYAIIDKLCNNSGNFTVTMISDEKIAGFMEGIRKFFVGRILEELAEHKFIFIGYHKGKRVIALKEEKLNQYLEYFKMLDM